MRSTSVRWGLAAAAFGVAAMLAAPPIASAKVAVGDVAPDFEGDDFFNTSPVTLKQLRGRLVFIELFSTG